MKKNDSKNSLWMNNGHRKPITRREMLAAGLIPFSATILTPNLIPLLLGGQEAQAQTLACPTASGGLIPFITVNLSGGAGLSGNFVPTDSSRNILTSYSKMGLGASSSLPIAREFGNVPFAGSQNGRLISQFLQGLRNGAPTALNKTAFVGVPTRTRDDSGDNPLSVDGLLIKAGLVGSSLPFLGNRKTATGINHKAAIVTPTAPLVVGSYNDISNSLGYAGSLGKNLNKKQQGVLASFISRLTQSQSRKLASMNSGETIKNLIDCAGIKNSNLLSGTAASSTDPRANNAFSQIWGINANTAVSNDAMVMASIAFNTLNGVNGSAAIELGGYDYHDNTRSNGDGKDLTAGQLVGRLLQSAELLNRPLFVYVCSDGSVTSAESNSADSPWTSDRGSASCAYILYFNPQGRSLTSDFQIGHFTKDQVADDKFITGANPEAAAAAVFANYMKLNNKMDVFDILAGKVLDRNTVNSVVKF